MILRPSNVSIKLVFSFLYAVLDSLSDVIGTKPPEGEDSDDVAPELLGAQDVLQSSQLFLDVLAKRGIKFFENILMKMPLQKSIIKDHFCTPLNLSVALNTNKMAWTGSELITSTTSSSVAASLELSESPRP